jgi:hypothetical protein
MTTYSDIVNFEVVYELLLGFLGILIRKNRKKYEEIKEIYFNLDIKN